MLMIVVFYALTAAYIQVSLMKFTYHEWSLSINIPIIDINLIVLKKCHNFMDVVFIDGLEKKVFSHLFDATNH